jgi:hypothetical protein
MRNFLLITFVLCFSCTSCQVKSIRGFLFPSIDVNPTTKVSFFLPFQIDTTLSLQENIKMIKNDTLMSVSFEKITLDSTLFIKNEIDSKLLWIVPVDVIFGDWSIELRGPFIKLFEAYPIKVFGQTIVSGYNEKKSYYIKQARNIKIQ